MLQGASINDDVLSCPTDNSGPPLPLSPIRSAEDNNESNFERPAHTEIKVNPFFIGSPHAVPGVDDAWMVPGGGIAEHKVVNKEEPQVTQVELTVPTSSCPDGPSLTVELPTIEEVSLSYYDLEIISFVTGGAPSF